MQLKPDQVDTIQLNSRERCIYLKVISPGLYDKLLQTYDTPSDFRYESGETTKVTVSAADTQTTTVRCFNLPPEVPHHVLSNYGSVLDIRDERWSTQYLLPLNNGVKAIRMELKQSIPTSLKIANYDVNFSHPGQEVNLQNLDFLGPRYNYICNVGDEQRGTTIVYRHGINVVSSEMHPSGRLTSLLTDMNTLYVNVYLHSGTNRKREREDFFTNQMPFYLRHRFHKIMLAGDFNCVLTAKDQKPEYHPSPALQRMCQDLNLIDLWEVVHGNADGFTYFRNNSASRLDRWYTNKGCQVDVQNIPNTSVPFSDHYCVIVSCRADYTTPPYGRSYWKLNSRLLHDEQAATEFKELCNSLHTRTQKSNKDAFQAWTSIYKPAIQSFFKWKGIEQARARRSTLDFIIL
ncbi:hypothetical protein ANN_13146 [Periplaneta americana]|uniref:Endonuclease/exonuclease/phosphatase domain-containing protein n=1 Tax=Periplaneta americana TaxID=6978 RepID=A0ABQ8TKU3_PERAM|nr:hypothetical protein ANN_13146 [Periplaneta americana]